LIAHHFKHNAMFFNKKKQKRLQLGIKPTVYDVKDSFAVMDYNQNQTAIIPKHLIHYLLFSEETTIKLTGSNENGLVMG